MKGFIAGLMFAIALMLAFTNACQTNSRELMTPHEIVRVAETTSLSSLEDKLITVMEAIEISLNQMGLDQLTEVLTTITLPEDRSLWGRTNDLRIVLLVMTTEHISKELLGVYRYKTVAVHEVERVVGPIFATYPFLLQDIIHNASTMAEKFKKEAEQMEEGETRDNLRLQAANLYNLAGCLIMAQTQLLNRAPAKPRSDTPMQQIAQA